MLQSTKAALHLAPRVPEIPSTASVPFQVSGTAEHIPKRGTPARERIAPIQSASSALQTLHPVQGNKKMSFGQLRQAVSSQLCDLLDDAGITATRVVSGRRFVRWDTVPKLLAQQNQYISGLPYDFFFSKSIAIPTNTAALSSPSTAPGLVTLTPTPTPSKGTYSHHNSDSDTLSNETAPRSSIQPPPSSSETAPGYGVSPDTLTNLSDADMELGTETPNEPDKDSTVGALDIVGNRPPVSNPSGNSEDDKVNDGNQVLFNANANTNANTNMNAAVNAQSQTPSSTAQTIIGQLHAQPLNINILSWKKSTIEDILAGLRKGRIRIGSRPQGRDVVFELITPENETIDIPKWPEMTVLIPMHTLNGDLNTLSPVGTLPSSTAGISSQPPSTSSNTTWNTQTQYQAEVGAIRNSRSDRERRRRLSVSTLSGGAGANPTSSSGASGLDGGATSLSPSSSTSATVTRSNPLKIRVAPPGAGLFPARWAATATAPATPATASFSPSVEEDVKHGLYKREVGPGENVDAQRGLNRPLSFAEDDTNNNNNNNRFISHPQHNDAPHWRSSAHIHGSTLSSIRDMKDSMDTSAQTQGQTHSAPPPPASSTTPVPAPSRTTFLTAPTPTKKWTRRSSPDRIFMNVTLNSLLRSAGMPIPRQKDDASRLPWSSIPQFLAERGLYVTGWPEANLPWLYAGDDGSSSSGVKNTVGGEWKDRIDWKSSPSQRSYKPLAQALRSGEIKILKRPQGREVLFEVRDSQGRLYDTTLGLSEEWKRRWMYGGTSNSAPSPRDGNGNGTPGPSSRKRRSGPREGDPSALTSDMDVDVEERRGRSGYGHSRSISNPIVIEEYARDLASRHPSGVTSPADSSSPVGAYPYDTKRPAPTPTVSASLGNSATYPPCSDLYPYPYPRPQPPPPSAQDSRPYQPQRPDPRQYAESQSRVQPPPPAPSAPYPGHGVDTTSRLPSIPVPIPESGRKRRERESPSPDSASQRQRTISLGTSSASTGTLPSTASSSSASTLSRRWYDLPPLRNHVEEDRRPGIGGDEGGNMRRNRLPPIQLPYDDMEDQKPDPDGRQRILLPPVQSIGSGPLIPFPSTPSTISIRSPLEPSKWQPSPATSSNARISPPIAMAKPSPPDIRPIANASSARRPSPPLSYTPPSIPNHVPYPQDAFSQPVWDAAQRAWKLRVLDTRRAGLPPVGERVEWDGSGGRWVVGGGDVGEMKMPLAFWNVEQQAWALVA